MLWFSSPFLVLPDKTVARRRDRRATYSNGHASTQITRSASYPCRTFAACSPCQDVRFHLPAKQAIFRIWPPNAFGLKWPAGTISDTSASYISDAVKEFMI